MSDLSNESRPNGPPTWVLPTVRRSLWYALGVVAAGLLGFYLLQALRGLLAMLVIAAFFAVAMEPAVSFLHSRRGMSRGRATGLIFLGLLAFVVVFLFVLIPSIVTVADQLGDKVPGWLDEVQQRFGISLGGESGTVATAEDLEAMVKSWLRTQADDILGLAASSIGLVFQALTIAAFTFYFVVDSPKLRRLVLTRFPPTKQERVGRAWDMAIQQTGGFFYSRLLLGVIYVIPFFIVELAIGMPWVIALVLAIFSAFFAEFIPVVGTYIGAAIPVVVVLGIRGPWQALVLVGWVVLYQQIENFWLAPKISARTMELSGVVAFGAAIAGGAVAGPMGAFMALPVAAMITSFLRTYGHSYELTYHSIYDDPDLRPGSNP